MGTTESQTNTDTELTKIAWLSAQNPNQEFHSLMHHINVEALRNCFNKLDGKKAVGTDGIDKVTYGKNLQESLIDLIERMKRMAYRPGPVRLVLIPKEGQRGATRPLGISNFEDKLVQKRMQEILESIYEPIFLNCSYGFRPGVGCHDAIKDLSKYLYDNEVETIIDVDLSNYFGQIDRKRLEELLNIKIKDTRFLRYINRMFKAGVLAEGELLISEEGVVQGSCCSPVLANIYAHYVIDTWLEEKAECMVCKVKMFRFADDCVICCRYETEAQQIKETLATRLAEFNLKLNEDKTKMVAFSKRKYNKGIKQDAFDFLGFTFYLGKSRNGFTVPKLKTIGKRFRSKLKKINEWARENRNTAPLKDIWKTFCSKLRGHTQYYGVSHNMKAISRFSFMAIRIMFKWINRRSQRRSLTWERFMLFMKLYPPPKLEIKHRLF